MNRGGVARFDPPSGPGLTGGDHSKPNRLRRSFKRTQLTQRDGEAGSPENKQPDFRSPPRVPRPRAGGVFSSESPHNDSDVQHDIIWDATSPSPNRFGKRGLKQRPPGVVDISEIVNRIAPKHGRPRAAEPTLQQWIGDTIPCTPDLQGPKAKKKSPRQNGVEDLLKLAKQFDLNMFHQGDAEEEERGNDVELLSEDLLETSDHQNQDDVSFSVPVNREPALKSSSVTDIQVQMDLQMEDDLDFLFDGPTQQISGNLSQVSQVKLSGKNSAVAAASSKNSPTFTPKKVVPASNEFEDDWENDDLLNDSLVLEMTQNPLKFSGPPKHSSTQKLTHTESTFKSPIGGLHNSQYAVCKAGKKDNLRQRATFKLETNPNSARKINTDLSWTDKEKIDHSAKKKTDKTETRTDSLFSGVSVDVVSKKNSQKPHFNQSASAVSSGVKSRPSASKQTAPSTHTWSNNNNNNVKVDFNLKTSDKKTDSRKNSFFESGSQNKTHFNQRTTGVHVKSQATSTHTPPSYPHIPRGEVNTVSLVQRNVPDSVEDEDLNVFFASDPVWDDPADDDLFSEMCEDLEKNQIVFSNTAKQSLPGCHVTTTKPSTNQRAALQPDNYRHQKQQLQKTNSQTIPHKQMPLKPAGTSLAAYSLPACDITTTTKPSTNQKAALQPHKQQNNSQTIPRKQMLFKPAGTSLAAHSLPACDITTTKPLTNQKAALQPDNFRHQQQQQQKTNSQTLPHKQMPFKPAGTSLARAGGIHMNTATDSFRHTQQAENISGSVNNSLTCVQGNGRKDQFTFKKPSNPVPSNPVPSNPVPTTATNKVAGKCSVAEIELKKQQAMERRRQRQQTTNNL